MGGRDARHLPEPQGQTVLRTRCHVSPGIWFPLPLVTFCSIIMTGWGMSAHEQALMISSKVSFLPAKDRRIGG